LVGDFFGGSAEVKFSTKRPNSDHLKGVTYVSSNEPVLAGVAQRYATAMFDLAQEADTLDSIAEELATLQRLLQENADLRDLVSSPLYAREDQAKGLAAVLEKAGATTLLKNFVGLVAQNRRLFALSDMIKAFQGLLARHRGEITASVTSAVVLNDDHLSSLKAALREALGRDVQLQANVDESLIGGLIVKVGSRMIDSSLKTKLSSLKIAMKEVG
jgi:F-type H+-transporting ATPase subunit delta